MNRMLVVEDEPAIREMLRLCLSKNGYGCETAENGAQAATALEARPFDLVLLDVMLPDYDGYELIEYIKEYRTPVIFVTAKAEVLNRVKGLALGADDYITKPFDLRELLARVQTVLRRCGKADRFLTAGKLKVDVAARTVLANGEPVALSTKEFDLLLYFLQNPNIALYREQIYERVWQEPYYGNTRTVDLHVQHLKKKLQLNRAIVAVYKIGYRFLPELAV